MSSPIVVRFIGGSFPLSGSTELPLWHIDAVGLRGLLTAFARAFIASPFRLARYKAFASFPPILRFNFLLFECPIDANKPLTNC
jgi:hypothetical protein